MKIDRVLFTDLLSEIVDNRGRTCPTVEHGIPLIATNCIVNDRLFPVHQKVRYVSDETYQTWFRGHPKPMDIIFVCKGSPGNVALAPDPVGFCIAQDMVAVRANPKAVYPRYLFAALRSRLVQNEVRNLHVGTLIPHFKKGDFDKLRIPLPDRHTQIFIGDLYFEMSAKAEVNAQLASKAKELAIAYATECLSQCDGPWVCLDDFVSIAKGVSYRSADLIPGDGWLVSLKCAGRDGSFQLGGLKPFSGPSKDAQVVDHGDIVVAQTDITQRAEVIGRPLRVERPALPGKLVASLDFAIVRPHSELTREVLFAVLNQQEFRDHVLGYCNGTTVLHMNSRAVPSYQFSLPDSETVLRITSVMGPLLERSDSARRENEMLGRFRDVLLTRLLSGELKAPEAEALAGELR